MGEEYTLHQESDDRLLDALVILELNFDFAHQHFFCMGRAETHLPPLIPQGHAAGHLLPAHPTFPGEGGSCFGLSLGWPKDWSRRDHPLGRCQRPRSRLGEAGTPKGTNKKKWKALVRDAKPHSKKLIAFLDPTSAASANTVRTKVK